LAYFKQGVSPNNSFKPNPLRGFSPKPASLWRVGLIQVLGAMGRFTKFLDKVPGHFRHGCENEFPWASRDRGIWYALLVAEPTGIEQYGFTAAVAQKQRLLAALQHLKPSSKAILLGVWTGNYRTDLFVLDVVQAKDRLQAVVAGT
jgi:hypothetical protein